MKHLLLLVLVPFFLFSCSKKDSSPKANQAPTTFTVAIGNTTDKTAVINWTESKDPEGGSISYTVNLNGQEVANNISGLTYTLNNLVKNNAYSGTVVASDASGNKTQASFSFTTTDAPVPSDFTLTAGTTTNKSVSFSWTASTLPGGGTVVYDVYLNNILKQPNLTVLNSTITGLQPNTDQPVKVVAKSADGKTLEKSIIIKTKVNTAPGNFTITKTDNGFSFVSLSCGLSTDIDNDTLTYYISRNGNVLNAISVNPAAAFSYVLKSLTPSTTYDLAVVAVDQFGAQTTSNTITVTTKAGPEDNFIASAKLNGSDVQAEWIANSQERFDVSASDFEIDGVKQSLFNVQVSFLNLPNNQLYVQVFIPSSKFTQNKLSNLRINLNWGPNETPTKSQINQFGLFTYTATTASVSQAQVKPNGNGTYGVVIHLNNDIISSQPTWSIEQIKLANAVSTGTITYTSGGGNIVYSVSGSVTANEYNYLKNYSDGFIIVKDSDGYHRLNFTYTVL